MTKIGFVRKLAVRTRTSFYLGQCKDLNMVYGYIRVSSDKQTVENQRFEITNFCAREGLSIDGWIEETISGTKSYSKRNLIAELRAIGMSQNKIAKICNVDRNPLSRFIRFKMAESRGCTGTL